MVQRVSEKKRKKKMEIGSWKIIIDISNKERQKKEAIPEYGKINLFSELNTGCTNGEVLGGTSVPRKLREKSIRH